MKPRAASGAQVLQQAWVFAKVGFEIIRRTPGDMRTGIARLRQLAGGEAWYEPSHVSTSHAGAPRRLRQRTLPHSRQRVSQLIVS